MYVTVLHESWHPHPLAWIHRVEARGFAEELRRAGHADETGTDRLRFLECDVAPLVGANSAFAASLEAAGMGRAEQLRMLLNETADNRASGLGEGKRK